MRWPRWNRRQLPSNRPSILRVRTHKIYSRICPKRDTDRHGPPQSRPQNTCRLSLVNYIAKKKKKNNTYNDLFFIPFRRYAAGQFHIKLFPLFTPFRSVTTIFHITSHLMTINCLEIVCLNVAISRAVFRICRQLGWTCGSGPIEWSDYSIWLLKKIYITY